MTDEEFERTRPDLEYSPPESGSPYEPLEVREVPPEIDPSVLEHPEA